MLFYKLICKLVIIGDLKFFLKVPISEICKGKMKINFIAAGRFGLVCPIIMV